MDWPLFDLLGKPIAPNHGEQGRPAHAFDPEIANKIRVLLCAGMKLGRIAKEVGLSVPTVRKVYFQNGKVNRAAAQRTALEDQRAKVLLLLDDAAAKGNVSAIKTQVQLIDQQIAKLMAGEEEDRRAKPAAVVRGKKDQARAAANDAEAGLTEWLEGEGGHVH